MNFRLLRLQEEVRLLSLCMLPDDRQALAETSMEHALSLLSDETDGFRKFIDPVSLESLLNGLVTYEAETSWRHDGADGLAAFILISEFVAAYRSNPLIRAVMQTMIEDQVDLDVNARP